jgi:4a-hydroxytetrahydrobiopterin dehydratase
MIRELSDALRAKLLQDLPRWRYDPERKAICRSLEFLDFAEALRAMVQIGLAAGAANHHPEWFNVCNRLDIRLTTHDAGGLSERDIDLARRIDTLVDPRTSGTSMSTFE